MRKNVVIVNIAINNLKNFHLWPAHYDFPKYKFEMWNKDTGICPVCSSMDRERLYRVYIETETDLLSRKYTMLHIAPEANVRDWFNEYKKYYVCMWGFRAKGSINEGN